MGGKEVQVTVTSLDTSSGYYILPNNAELVSAVYQIGVSETLPSPVTLEVQHCVDLPNENATSAMSFVRCDLKQKSRYQLKAIEGGQFTPKTFYGKIELSHFSDIGIIVWIDYFLHRTYVANIFKQQLYPTFNQLHVVVTQNITDHITVSCIFDVYTYMYL